MHFRAWKERERKGKKRTFLRFFFPHGRTHTPVAWYKHRDTVQNASRKERAKGRPKNGQTSIFLPQGRVDDLLPLLLLLAFASSSSSSSSSSYSPPGGLPLRYSNDLVSRVRGRLSLRGREAKRERRKRGVASFKEGSKHNQQCKKGGPRRRKKAREKAKKVREESKRRQKRESASDCLPSFHRFKNALLLPV